MYVLDFFVCIVGVFPFAQKVAAKDDINVRSSSIQCFNQGVCKTCGSLIVGCLEFVLKWNLQMLLSWRVPEVVLLGEHGQTLVVYLGALHIQWSNRARCWCQDVILLMWLNGWTPPANSAD